MESKEFVIEQVEKLSKKYPFSNIKYYFDDFDNDHFICVSSKSDLNNIFSEQAWAIDEMFISKFPNELLSFILLEDYLEFGESGVLVCDKNFSTSLETISKNLGVFSFKDQKNFEFKERTEHFLAKSKQDESVLLSELDEIYAFAA